MPTSKQIIIIYLPAIVFLILGAVFYSSVSNAHPAQRTLNVAWDPEDVTISLSPGETTTTEVTATISCKHKKLSVAVSPELEPYISVSPSKVPKCKKKKWGWLYADDSDERKRWLKRNQDKNTIKIKLKIIAGVPEATDPQILNGDIFLKSKRSASSENLLINLFIQSTGQQVGVADGEVSLLVPSGLVVGDVSDQGINRRIVISEPNTFYDEIHGNSALDIQIYDMSKMPYLGMNPTIYDLANYLIAHAPNGPITTKTIGSYNFLVVYDEAVDGTFYATSLDQTRILTIGGGDLGGGSMSDSEVESILSSIILSPN